MIYAKLGDLVSKQRCFFWLLQHNTFLFFLSCLRFPVPSAVSVTYSTINLFNGKHEYGKKYVFILTNLVLNISCCRWIHYHTKSHCRFEWNLSYVNPRHKTKGYNDETQENKTKTFKYQWHYYHWWWKIKESHHRRLSG